VLPDFQASPSVLQVNSCSARQQHFPIPQKIQQEDPMTIRIRSDSTSAVVRGYAVDSHNTLVWLELAPQHPKTIGAIWVDQVVQQRPWLQLGDFDVAGSSQSHRSAVRAVKKHRGCLKSPFLSC
jgi:hypothetical protein